MWINFEVVTLIVTSIVPYLPGLSDTFIFDDRPAVSNNKVLHSCSFPFQHLISKDFWGKSLSSKSSHKSFRPLTSSTFWLQLKYLRKCEEDNIIDESFNNEKFSRIAFVMKLTNLVINALNTTLLYFLLKILIENTQNTKEEHVNSMLPFSMSLVFSIHPVHTEAVLSIVGRADLLYTMFLLLTLVFTYKNQSSNKMFVYAVIFIFTSASLLSKEQGILVLPLLLAIKLPSMSPRKISSLIFVTFIVSSVSILSYFRLSLNNFETPEFRKEDNPLIFSSGITRILTTIYLASLNIFILIVPVWLCFDWSMGCVPMVNPGDIRILAVIAFIVIIIGLVMRALKSFPVYLGLCFITIPFLLCLNILVDVGFVLAERNLYLSVCGYSILYHLGFLRLLTKCSNTYKKYLMKFLHVWVIMMLTSRTLQRSGDWQSDFKLYLSGLKVCPANGKVYYNLAKVLAESNSAELLQQIDNTSSENPQKLIKTLYVETLRQAPEFEHAMNNLANIIRGEGDLSTAKVLLTKAVNINPDFPAAHMNLGIVLMRSGDFSGARNHFDVALELRYPYPDCVYNLGVLHLKMSDFVQAEQNFRLGVSWNHVLSYMNLIILLDNQDKLHEAREIALGGVKLFPAKSDFRFQLGNIYGKMGEYVESELNYLEALKMETKVSYLFNLGVLYHRWGKMSEATQAYKKVLKLSPNHTKAKAYLQQTIRS